MSIHGFHPFQPIVPTVFNDIHWQDWILSDQVFDNTLDSFKCDPPPPNHNSNFSVQAQLPFHPMMMSADSASSSQCTLALNADITTDILTVMHAMLSWKACQVEGKLEWHSGRKHLSSIGAQDRPCGPKR